jgi:hypothetical protein
MGNEQNNETYNANVDPFRSFLERYYHESRKKESDETNAKSSQEEIVIAAHEALNS